MKFSLKALAVAAGLLSAIAPVAAQEASIAGNWETGPRDYRYQLQLCGPSGEDLCGIMTYGLDQSPQIQRYVGKNVFNAAKRIGPNAWKGNIIFAGHRMNGTVRLVHPDKLEIDGCAMLIICGTFAMYREGSTIPR